MEYAIFDFGSEKFGVNIFVGIALVDPARIWYAIPLAFAKNAKFTSIITDEAWCIP